MNNKTWSLIVGGSFIGGVVITVLLMSKGDSVPSGWMTVELDRKGISYSSNAAFASDIAFPGVKGMTGKVKFLREGRESTDVRLGYLLSVSVNPLDRSKVPAKYLVERPEIYEGQRVVRPPIREVVYEAKLYFALLDPDGFRLRQVESKPMSVYSDRTNEYQEVVETPIPAEMAARTAKVVVTLGLTRCSTCE